MRFLIVEDDKAIARAIKQILSSYGEIDIAETGTEAILYAGNNIYDCILLDIMLPEVDGFKVLAEIRKKSVTPVLMLTARDSVQDKVRALKGGADDYLVKPFFKEELVARIDALLRRYNKDFNKNIVTFLDLQLNLSSRTAQLGPAYIDLPGKFFDLLEFFIRNTDNILTKEQIFNRIWGFDSDTILSVVEVYVSNLRKILKEFDYHKYLHTMRNVGYLLTPRTKL